MPIIGAEIAEVVKIKIKNLWQGLRRYKQPKLVSFAGLVGSLGDALDHLGGNPCRMTATPH